MAAGKSSRINRQYKTKYRIRNWREYERGLRSRGDVTIPRRSVSANRSPSPEHRQAPGIWAENGDEIHKKRSNIKDIRAWRWAQSGANPSLARFPCFTGKKQGISWIRPRIGGIEAS